MPISFSIKKAGPIGSDMIALGHFDSPYMTVYDFDSSTDTFTKQTAPTELPSNNGFGIKFSYDNTYLAQAGGTYPKVYKGTPYAKLTDPAGTNGSITDVTWSKTDDTYMVYTSNVAPGIFIYKRSGDTFSLLPALSTQPGLPYESVFSPDDTYLAVASAQSPFISVYKRSGDTFTKLSDPGTLPPSSAACVDFSPDGTYVAVGGNNSSPRLNIYKRSGDTFTKLATPTGAPTSNITSVAFSRTDSTYLAMTHSVTPWLTIFKRSGDTFTQISTPTGQAGSSDCDFSADDSYLAVAHLNSPYFTVYKRSGDTFTAISAPASLPPNRCEAVHFSN